MECTSLVIGIDPGKKGAIVVLKDGEVYDVHTWDIKGDVVEEMKKSGYLHLLLPRVKASIFLEDVRLISPGKKAISSLSQQIGFIQGLVFSNLTLCHLIKPKKWQKHFGLEKCTATRKKKGTCEVEESYTDYKKRIAEFAEKQFNFKNKQAADAFLIAKYGFTNECNGNE